MKFYCIMFTMVFYLLFISCKNGVGEKKTYTPSENTIPSKEYKKIEESTPDMDRQKTIKKPVKQNSEKKKLKARDTQGKRI